MTKRHRRRSTARKREIVEAYLNGESMRDLRRFRSSLGETSLSIGPLMRSVIDW